MRAEELNAAGSSPPSDAWNGHQHAPAAPSLSPQLEWFLEKRTVAWNRLVSEGSIPAWLVSWVQMALALPPGAQPDYQVTAAAA